MLLVVVFAVAAAAAADVAAAAADVVVAVVDIAHTVVKSVRGASTLAPRFTPIHSKRLQTTLLKILEDFAHFCQKSSKTHQYLMIFELVENIRKPYPPQRDKTKVLSLKVKVEISKLICLLFSHTPVGRWPGELIQVLRTSRRAARGFAVGA